MKNPYSGFAQLVCHEVAPRFSRDKFEEYTDEVGTAYRCPVCNHLHLERPLVCENVFILCRLSAGVNLNDFRLPHTPPPPTASMTSRHGVGEVPFSPFLLSTFSVARVLLAVHVFLCHAFYPVHHWFGFLGCFGFFFISGYGMSFPGRRMSALIRLPRFLAVLAFFSFDIFSSLWCLVLSDLLVGFVFCCHDAISFFWFFSYSFFLLCI